MPKHSKKKKKKKKAEKMSQTTFTIENKILKADSRLGLIFGWAMICKEDGEVYVDTQNNTIPEHEMMKASLTFALSDRVAKEQHEGEQTGVGVFMFPLTEEIAKVYGIECDTSGLMWAVHASSETIAKFESGELTGFSIGGEHGTLKEVEVD